MAHFPYSNSSPVDPSHKNGGHEWQPEKEQANSFEPITSSSCARSSYSEDRRSGKLASGREDYGLSTRAKQNRFRRCSRAKRARSALKASGSTGDLVCNRGDSLRNTEVNACRTPSDFDCQQAPVLEAKNTGA
jgi:hypothetical protein